VFVPVVGLTGFHIGLLCKGRTTNEHVTGKFRGVNNPFDQGCLHNYLTVLCSSKFPRFDSVLYTYICKCCTLLLREVNYFVKLSQIFWLVCAYNDEAIYNVFMTVSMFCLGLVDVNTCV